MWGAEVDAFRLWGTAVEHVIASLHDPAVTQFRKQLMLNKVIMTENCISWGTIYAPMDTRSN